MLLAPLIIVVAGIARVNSRIVRGVGQEKRAGHHRVRTPPRKIRTRFRGCKHTSLMLLNRISRVPTCTQNDLRNVCRNAKETVGL
jgi:hypothetical protein